MASIISFVNQKGGTGKTTACITIASCLARKGHRTLLLDLISQANSTLALGIDTAGLKQSVYDVLLNHAALPAIFHKNPNGLTIAPATTELANTDISLEGHQLRLKEVLQSHQESFDFILIDCPPALNLLTLNALAASNGVVIPILCDYFSMEGLKQLLKTITKVRNSFNKKLRILGILPNMVDHRRNLTDEILTLIKKEFKNLVFNTEIPISVALTEASSFGKDIFSYSSWSTGAEAYEKVVKELLKRVIK